MGRRKRVRGEEREGGKEEGESGTCTCTYNMYTRM